MLRSHPGFWFLSGLAALIFGIYFHLATVFEHLDAAFRFSAIVTLGIVVFLGLTMGIFSLWLLSRRNDPLLPEKDQGATSAHMDISELLFQPKLRVDWMARNYAHFKDQCTSLERITHLLSFINYTAELPRQLRLALHFGHEIFPNVSFYVFLARHNSLRFELGSRPTSAGLWEVIADDDPQVDRIFGYVQETVDLKRLAESQWRSFSLPSLRKKDMTPSIRVMPLQIWDRIRGLIVFDQENGESLKKHELVLATLLNSHITLFLENFYLHEEKLQQQRVHQEIDIAGQIQSRSLPQNPPVIGGFDIFGMCLPCYEVSGDYYDLLPLPGDRLLVTVADVSGKGLPAALFLSKIQTLVRAFTDGYHSPAQFLTLLSAKMTQEHLGNLFATMLVIELRSRQREVLCASAGHCHPLVIRPKSGYVEEIRFDNGIPLGLFDQPEIGYTDLTIDLLPGDGLFLYTDGITDVVNSKHERFGLERLKAVLDQGPLAGARDILAKVENATDTFKGDAPQQDDITMVYLKSE